MCDSPVNTTTTTTGGGGGELFYNYYYSLGRNSINKQDITIFRCNADGSGQRAFATTSGYITQRGILMSAPRKGKIVFDEPIPSTRWRGTTDPLYNIVIANTSGTDGRLLVKGDSTKSLRSPVLSPDASLITYSMVSYDPLFKEDLHIINADGSNDRVIATDIQYESIPAFSPDGTRLAYYTRNDEIAVISTDGSNKIIVANNTYSNNDFSSFLNWSPDGQEIVFMSHSKSNSRFADISIATIATSQTRTIISSTTYTSGMPIWSPDGSSIAFVQISYNGKPTPDSRIYTCNTDGSNIKTVFNQPLMYGFYPQWSPDGKKISFTVADSLEFAKVVTTRIFDVASSTSILLANNTTLAYWAR